MRSAKGLGKGKLPYELPQYLPVFRYTHGMGGARAGKVVAIKWKKKDQWVVIKPNEWWTLMTTEQLTGDFVPSNELAKKALRSSASK